MPISMAGNPLAFLQGAGGSPSPAGPTMPAGPGAPGGMPGAPGGGGDPQIAAQNPMLMALARRVMSEQANQQYKKAVLKQMVSLLKDLMGRSNEPEEISDLSRSITSIAALAGKMDKKGSSSASAPEIGSILGQSIQRQQQFRPSMTPGIGMQMSF